MTTMTANLPGAETFTILQKSVCITLHCHYFGNTRKVDMDDIDLVKDAADDGAERDDVGVDKDQVRLTKYLVDRKSITPVHRVIGKAKSYLRSKSIQAHRVFGESSYLVPLASLAEVVAALKGFAAEIAIEVEPIAARWADIVAEQAARLGPELFDASQYPSADDVRKAFGIDWGFVSFQAPEQIASVDSALYETIKAEKDAQLTDAYYEVVRTLREDALRVARDLAAKLAPAADGKPKRLHPSALKALAAYVEGLPERDLTDDAPLRDALARVTALADGVDVEALRSSDVLRAELRAAAEQASETLAGLVKDAGIRAISFDGKF